MLPSVYHISLGPPGVLVVFFQLGIIANTAEFAQRCVCIAAVIHTFLKGTPKIGRIDATGGGLPQMAYSQYGIAIDQVDGLS